MENKKKEIHEIALELCIKSGCCMADCSECGSCDFEEEAEKKYNDGYCVKKTNRQWLESLTDEQMADVFVVQRYRKCTCCIYEDSIDCTENDCRQGYMQWLQAEHKDD